MDYLILKWINQFAGKYFALDMFGIICSDFFIFLIPLIIFIFYYFIRRKRKRFGLIVIKTLSALGLALLISYLIGIFLPRSRPFLKHREIFQLTHFFASSADLSFPSDHTAIAFVIVLTVLWDWKKLGLFLLIPAFMVGLARVFVGVHWPLDILGGISVAILSVLLVKAIFKKLWKI